MITLLYILLIVIVVCITMPWLAFTIMKLGAYGFLKGKQMFNKESDDGEK